MRTKRISRGFRCTIAELAGAAGKIAEGLDGPEFGEEVGKKLPERYPVEFRQLIARVSEFSELQASAMGDYHLLTEQKAASELEVEDLMSHARRSARLAHRSNPALLHDEYAVGRHEPQALSSLVGRAEQIAGACVRHADLMALNAWNEAATASLQEATERLKSLMMAHVAAFATQVSMTSGLILAANELYRACLTVQIAARLAFDARKADDPSIVEARGRFLLGMFPFRRRKRTEAVAVGTSAGGDANGLTNDEGPRSND